MQLRISFWDKACSMAILLRDEIEKQTGVRMLVSNRISPTAINYGNGSIRSEYNSPDFIHLCASKYAFSKHMLAHKQYTPEFRRGVPDVFPCLVREFLDGFSGRGIHVFETAVEYRTGNMNRNYWWTPWVSCDTEYRVHVLGGKFVKIMKKIPKHAEARFPIRNSYTDYHYRIVHDFSKWRKMMELEKKLENILVGGYYALDVGWDPAKKEYFIFEANSAPGLNSQTVICYATFLAQKLGLKVKTGGADEFLRPATHSAGVELTNPRN